MDKQNDHQDRISIRLLVCYCELTQHHDDDDAMINTGSLRIKLVHLGKL